MLKTVGYVLLIAQLLIIVGVGLSYYTIIQSLMSTLSPGGGTPVQYNGSIDESTGAFSGNLVISLRNPGMLEVAAHVSVRLDSEDGATLYQTSGDRRLAAGSSGSLELPLSVSGTDVQHIRTVVLGLKLATLFDLLSFSVDIPIPAQMGGGAPE